MTSCMAVKDNICAYLDNELSQEERRLFEEHVQSCDACKQELDEMSEIIGLCTSLPQQELPEGFREDLHEKLVAAADKQKSNVTDIGRSKRLGYIKMISSVAAGLLLIFLTGSLIKYGFFQSGNKAQTGSTAMSAMDAPAQPSVNERYGSASDNGAATGATEGASAGAAAGATPENAVSAQAANDVQGIVNFNVPAAAPSGTEADRSVSENDRSSAVTYAASMAVDEKVGSKYSAIAITTDDPAAITEKIAALALENNGGLKEPALLKSAKIASDDQTAEAGSDAGNVTGTGSGAGGAAVTADTGTETAQPLNYVIPAANYDKFMSSVNSTFGAANVQAGALVTEDLTGSLKDKMKQSDDIDAQIQELQKDSAKNADKLNELRTAKEELDSQIETIRLDSDFITVTIYINKK